MQDDMPVQHVLQEEQSDVIATNSTVKLTCTLAAMMGIFALFLCFAEKRSPAIRRYAVQSTALSVFHVLAGFALLGLGSVMGLVPILGFLVTLLCWLVYIALLIPLVVVRIRMMLAAYQGIRFDLPIVGNSLNRFIHL